MLHAQHQLAFALPLAVALIAAPTTGAAFTDSNAELKEAAADRPTRVVVAGKATPSTAGVWVPVSSKRLDGFRPVLPPTASTPRRLAEAGTVPAHPANR